jgi:four helix bundle protein
MKLPRVIGRQSLRSGTSIAANYRATCRARFNAQFVAKMGTVVEEADETAFWLDLVAESQLVDASRLESLRNEALQLLKIFSSSLTTAKSNR